MKNRIIITGAAGLVGLNLISRLRSREQLEIIAIDKHPANMNLLRRLHPGIKAVTADLAVGGVWRSAFDGGGALILSHAQIGGLDDKPFILNNITATQNVLEAAKTCGVEYIVHISSSVVNSKAHDFYSDSKKVQERLVIESGIPACVLRPTLLFGWFDRKHLGWLARYMQRTPLFPIPGTGRYIRQPLYAADFCNIIISALERPRPGEIHNISGRAKVHYIDVIRTMREAIGVSAPIVKIPYGVFWMLLKVYAAFNRDPPFTTDQLQALVTPDEFEIIDWPTLFGVRETPLAEALRETFSHPVYSKIVPEF